MRKVVKRVNKTTVKTWINRISTSLLIAFLMLIVFFAISSKISGGSPKIFGHEVMTVLSGSMEPSIQTGSIIAVTPVEDPTSYQVGDVITYRSISDPNVLITHRIIEVNGTGMEMQYVTMGDNNDAKDPTPIPAANVIGEYANFTIPYLGYFFNFVKSKAGIASVLIIPGIALIVWQMISLWKALVRAEKEKEEQQLHSETGVQQPPTQSV
jgi:signal peptidase